MELLLRVGMWLHLMMIITIIDWFFLANIILNPSSEQFNTIALNARHDTQR